MTRAVGRSGIRVALGSIGIGYPHRWTQYLAPARGYGEGEGQLFDPIGLAVDAAGRVYVADWLRGRGRVHGCAPDGRLLGTWSVGDDGQRLRLPTTWSPELRARIASTPSPTS